MANTATTASVLDHTSDAAFRTWVAEIITALGTTLTLTQTADTGQINTATVTRPAANTAAGYTIWRFNDTLQSTSPIFIKLEFGTGVSASNPQMWMTIGQGSNGSGTLTGNLSTRVAVTCGNAPSSTSTSYTSRFVYNPTYGFLAMVWKINGQGTATASQGGFILSRSNDSTGAATGDAVWQLTNSASATGTSTSTGYMQIYSYLTSLVYPATLSNGNYWMSCNGNSATPIPFNDTNTTYSGNSQTFPVVYKTPVYSMSNFATVGLLAEEPLGSTFSETVIGSTALTYLSVGQMFGGTYLGPTSTSTAGMNILWQ